jgi:hypothetical protein
MMPRQASNAKQLPSLGETPAEARRRMSSSGGAEAKATPPLGEEVEGPLQPQHIAAIREAEEGFGGGPTEGATVEEAGDMADPPSPAKAMETIRQLGQDKNQAIAERDAALNLVSRYKAKYGELD